MSKLKFKPGQFVSTTEGRMRVKKTKDGVTCDKCIFGGSRLIIDPLSCKNFRIKYPGYTCVELIGWYCYLEKV